MLHSGRAYTPEGGREGGRERETYLHLNTFTFSGETRSPLVIIENVSGSLVYILAQDHPRCGACP